MIYDNIGKIEIYKNENGWHIDSSRMESDEETLNLMIETTICLYEHIVENANKKDFLKTMEKYYDKEKC